jgi:hypothetical protein
MQNKNISVDRMPLFETRKEQNVRTHVFYFLIKRFRFKQRSNDA